MTTKENFLKAVKEIKKAEEARKDAIKFDQSVDVLVNLKNFDIKRASINTIAVLPHKIKDKKVAGFLDKKSNFVDTITKPEFEDFKDKKKLKKLVDNYDFFIANAKLMPTVATSFGRALGPAGKMPSPQLGMIASEDESTIKNLIKKIENVVKIKTKEPSIKISISRLSAKDEDIAENAVAVFNEIFKNLQKGKENLKSVLIKTTMGKPVKVPIS